MTLQRFEPAPGPGGKVEFDEKGNSAALFTILMILAVAGCYAMGAKKEEFWLAHNCWSIGSMADLIQSHNYGALINPLLLSNFASFNMLHMGLTMYFFWVFGGHIESRIGTARYLPLVLFGCTLPWLLLQFEAGSMRSMTYFGALFIQCAIIGGYVVIPPKPLKAYGQGTVQPKNQIFKKEERKDPRSKYIANPLTFIAVFVGCQAFFHFWCNTGIPNPIQQGTWWLAPFGKTFDTFRLFPCILAFAIGYAVASMSVASASQALNEGPLAVQALRRYRELLDLDVKHEEALRGTARTLGLSYDKTKELIARNKNKMRIK
ncbi:MAG TPA: rhomboid family intramembrane serine protease [Oculatellaceae cyanobacterium]